MRPVTPGPAGSAGSVARGRSHTGSPPPRFRGAWLGFLSRPGAPRRGAQPRGAHGRGGRGVGRTRGWAAGRPAFAPETVSQPFLGISCPGSGPDREMRCCGPLRASDGSTMAGSGPFRGPLEPGGAGRSGESARLRGRGGSAVVKRPRGGPQDALLSLRSLSLVVLRVAMVLDNEARETALRASGAISGEGISGAQV